MDIETTDDGDILIDKFGDLKVASPLRTITQGINNVILTNKGELLMEPTFGANLQQFYGEPNVEEIRSLMERNIIGEVDRQQLMDPADVTVDAVAIDIDSVALITTVQGIYPEVEDTGNLGGLLNIDDGVTMAYIYPFTSGIIEKAESVDETNFAFF